MMPTPRTALIADADPRQRAATAAVLRAAGYEVRAAADGTQALLLLAGFTPDIAVIDLVLPEVSGFRVLDAIKDTIRVPTRVVVASSLGSPAHRAYADALGADAFLLKPFTADDLLAGIGRPDPIPTIPPAPFQTANVRRRSVG